jgi:hypothetical protein
VLDQPAVVHHEYSLALGGANVHVRQHGDRVYVLDQSTETEE